MFHELVAALVRFFSDEHKIAELREALARHTWNVAVAGSDEERDLAGELELALAEYEAGHISFDECRARIGRRVNGLLMIGPPGGVKTETEVRVVRQRQWMAAVDIQPSSALSSARPQTA